MKSLQDLKNKQDEMNKLYDKVHETNTYANNVNSVIIGHWVDFIGELLYFNLNDDTPTELTDEIERSILITQKQAEEELDSREEQIKEFPYGTFACLNSKGIYLEKLEIDILKWILDKD